jgi:hypothetical protein
VLVVAWPPRRGRTGKQNMVSTHNSARQKVLRSTRVQLEPIGLTEQGQRYRVTYAGETLVEGPGRPNSSGGGH